MADELLTVIVASVSCAAFCLVMVTLLVVLCRNQQLCCGFRPPPPEAYQEEVFQYCSSQSLISHSACPATIHRTPDYQHPSGLFVVGKPNHYHLAGPLPRLPSYESVRKKDKQRHIHSLIAQRFGLGMCSQPSPSYEESLWHSVDVSTIDLHSLDSELSMQAFQRHSYFNQDIQRGAPTAEHYTDSCSLSLHSGGSVRI